MEEVMQLEGVFYLGLILSLLVLAVSVSIGVWSRRLTRSLGDYYVAGRSIGALNNGLAMVSLGLSLITFLGLTALIIEGVYVAVAVYASFTAAFVGLLILAAPFLRRYKSFTTMAFISERYYSHELRLLSVVFMLIVSILYLGGNIKGIGIIFELLLGIPEIYGIIVGGLVVTIYVVIGGMYGVTYNQTFQSIVLIFCLMFPVAIILQQLGAGGWYFPPFGYGDMVPEMLEHAPHYFSAWVVHPVTYVGLALGSFFGIIGLPHFVMRYFTVRDSKEARWSTVITVFLVGLINSAVYATGFAAVYWMQKEGLFGQIATADYDQMVFILTENLAGEGWLAIAIAGSVAAGLSTVSGLLMIMGVGLVHDLYSAIKPNIDDSKKLRLSYLAMLAAGILVTIISIKPPEFILEAIMWAFGIAAASLGVPIVMGIWWKRATREGAGAGMVAGFLLTFVPCVFILIMGREPTEIPIPLIAPYLYGPMGWIKMVAIAVPVSFILTVVVSWFTAEPPQEVKQSVDAMHGWEDYVEERYNGWILPVSVIFFSLLIMALVFMFKDTFS